MKTIRYALLTPVRDEEAFLADMMESVAIQSPPPCRWILVDDGSRDRTAAIIRDYQTRLDSVELIQLPPRHARLPGGEGAVPQALHRLDLEALDFVARFDADLVLSPDYMARLLEEFARRPRLGIAGGALYVQRAGRMELEEKSEVHVRGALKMYRTACLQEIGGISTRIGWDTLDEVTAWAHGWETRSFPSISALHRRPTGEGISAVQVYGQRGRAEYLTWSDPVFVLGKAVKLALGDRSPLRALCYLAGFWGGYTLREPRVQDPRIVRVRRSRQRNRMRQMLRAPFL